VALQAAATDAGIYARYDTADVAVLQIARELDVVEQFRDVFGMRFLALHDEGNVVYNGYRVPDPVAPYPQDYVIDQDGIIRYWSWEYDPQVIIATIDSLLAHSGIAIDVPADGFAQQGGDLRLARPAPNPFGPATDIRFWLRTSTQARLAVYSPEGRLVRVLAAGDLGPGVCTARWDGLDRDGDRVASGVYFIDLSTRGARVTRRAVLLR
jgi:hypothetical protein